MIRILANEFQGYFAFERLVPAIEGRSGVDALIVTIEAYIDAISQSGSLGRAYYELFGESVALVPEIHEIFVGADVRLRPLVEQTILSAIESNEIPNDVDPAAIAAVVVAILRGVSMQWVLDSDALNLNAVKGEIRRLFELAFTRPQEDKA